jgi:dienelactone hydrolase
LEGYLAWDDSLEGERPGVVVVHEWYGLNDYAKRRARMVAELGYVAFAADIYGKGMRATTSEEASKLSAPYRADRGLMRARVSAALDVLKAYKITYQDRLVAIVDKDRTAAIGYCFGGTTVLELARSGADVGGVVSFHGGLGTPEPADARNIKGSVLVLHGADDPYVGAEQVADFQNEMRDAGVDWQMVFYGGAVHSFTNPASGSDNSKGVAYNERADRRSWKAMKVFLKEIFKK